MGYAWCLGLLFVIFRFSGVEKEENTVRKPRAPRPRSRTDEQYLKRLGKKVAIMRSAAGYTPDEFATAAGLHRSFFRKLESGEANPSVLVLKAIAETLQVDILLLLPSLR